MVRRYEEHQALLAAIADEKKRVKTGKVLARVLKDLEKAEKALASAEKKLATV